ncbi:MAG: UDP-N-acetylmuramate--L-alanine ligase [Chlamydiia bacterium]|nr:UDP-N-acetylmuramate--L-alanine ligase [Chlamydiia bacterium]
MTVCCYKEVVESDLKNGVHLAGIGGVGMTALAEMLLDLGIKVSGSDINESKNVEYLRSRGVEIFASHKKENISNQLVCRTRAVKDDNEEVCFAKKAVFRSALLGFLAKGKKQLVVTGAHGKTSTSALLAHCMEFLGFDISYAVGGLSPSLQRYGKIGSSDFFVIEGDESDGSHLNTDPYGGILTSLDVDHLAFWKKGEALIDSYFKFISKIKEPKHFCFYGEDKALPKKISGISYGSFDCKYNLGDIEILFDKSVFYQEGHRILFPMYGEYNAKNALAVYALLRSFDIEGKKIREALSSFKGILRRMEYLGKNIYSDYAHHPEEVKCVMKDVSKFSDDVIIIFEPHRLSRFFDELDNFCKVFKNVIITDVFNASEGLNIDQKPLIDKFCKKTNSKYVSLKNIPKFLDSVDKKILALGAGSLDKVLREYVKK